MTLAQRLLPLLAAAMLATLPAAAQADETAFASAPIKGSFSVVRLLAAGPAQSGVYRAGVEIELEPKTITYWRQPGEAGSPPVFDFSRSENVARVETLYPAPKHIEEAGIVVAGYDRRVIFPLRVTPKDPKAPAALRLTLDYAACGKICLPARAELSLALPQSGVSPHAEAIAGAERQVPKKIAAADAKKRLALARKNGAADPAWSLRYLGPGRAQDVFAEVAEPLFVDSKRAGEDFELTLFTNGASAKSADATLTIVTDGEAFEAPARLE